MYLSQAGISYNVLWTRCWTFLVRTRRGISWLAEQLLASEWGHLSVELLKPFGPKLFVSSYIIIFFYSLIFFSLLFRRLLIPPPFLNPILFNTFLLLIHLIFNLLLLLLLDFLFSPFAFITFIVLFVPPLLFPWRGPYNCVYSLQRLGKSVKKQCIASFEILLV
jgi:hypothetical protein